MSVQVFDLEAPKVKLFAEHGCGWVAWRWAIESEDGAMMMSRSFPTAQDALADMEEFTSNPKEWDDADQT